MRAFRFGTSWGGLLSGPLAWAISTQLNYMLPGWECEHGKRLVPFVALALMIFALSGGALSWRARHTGGAALLVAGLWIRSSGQPSGNRHGALPADSRML